jgi:integrase
VIKKDASGRWGFVVGVSPDGKRRQAHRRGFATKKEAQAVLDALRVESRQGTYVPPARQTLGDFLDVDWLPTERRKLTECTWESYVRNVRNHVTPALGGVQLQALDAGMINRFYGQLLTAGRKRGTQSPDLKPRTVRYIHTILHAALDDAVRWRRIPLNPADQADPPSVSESKAPEMHVWTGPELGRFLALCEGDRYYWPFLFLATTGCRRGEALGLRWTDVDLDEAAAAIHQECIPLTNAAGVGREGRIVARTKGDKPRVIELDAATVGALRRWKALQAAERLAIGAGFNDRGLVFACPDTGRTTWRRSARRSTDVYTRRRSPIWRPSASTRRCSPIWRPSASTISGTLGRRSPWSPVLMSRWCPNASATRARW